MTIAQYTPPPRVNPRAPSQVEKVWNARINVWLRSPGLLLSSYAVLLAHQRTRVRVSPPWVVALTVALATLNGQYYMQKVVANTAVKVNGRGAC